MKWRVSKHAIAYSSLVKKGGQYDPDCIGCHTVGYNYHSGFETMEGTAQLANVGCEACHGPGSLHVNNLQLEYGQVTESTCVGCHNEEHSKNFNLTKYENKIRHYSGTLRESSESRKQAQGHKTFSLRNAFDREFCHRIERKIQ
jgi:hypothetical protein